MSVPFQFGAHQVAVAIQPHANSAQLREVFHQLLPTDGQARRLGWARVMLVGDAPYYSRFGFRRLEGVIMPPPTNPARALGFELASGAWAGITGEVRAWNDPEGPDRGAA